MKQVRKTTTSARRKKIMNFFVIHPIYEVKKVLGRSTSKTYA